MAFKGVDLFRSGSEDHSNPTMTGGILTILSICAMLILFMTETLSFIDISITKETLIDQDKGSDLLDINMDIVLPQAPCVIVSLDYMDSVKNHLINVMDKVRKIRIDSNGNPIDENIPMLNRSNVIQAIDDQEGCQLKGTLSVVKVPGNFHISFHAFHDMIHQLTNDRVRQLGFSHTINHLSFGNQDNSLIENYGEGDHTNLAPYDGLKVEEKPAEVARHDYYISVIPTQYLDESTSQMENSYQYVMSSRKGPIHSLFGAIWFKYSVENITMRYTLQSKSFLHFLVNLFAILGGIFVVLGIINSTLQEAIRVATKTK